MDCQQDTVRQEGGVNILLELLYGRVGAVDRYSNKPYLLNLALKQWLTHIYYGGRIPLANYCEWPS